MLILMDINYLRINVYISLVFIMFKCCTLHAQDINFSYGECFQEIEQRLCRKNKDGECIQAMNYAGTKHTARGNKTCRRWDEWLDRDADRLFINDGNSRANARNYCRNIDNSTKPWCFIIPCVKSGTSGCNRSDGYYAYCDIPLCSIPICERRDGLSNCRCNIGYQQRYTHRNCTDVDECATNNGGCGNENQCINTEGNYKCICRAGYQGSSDEKNCADIDECDTSNGGCQENCINTEGSYYCTCPTGFRGSERNRVCTDINECSEAQHICEQKCTNNPGSYECSCNITGYEVSSGDSSRCNDVDECRTTTHGCEQICNNTVVSYHCECNEGYTVAHEDPKKCQDIDECQLKELCGEHTCYNNIGSYGCHCMDGFCNKNNPRECQALPISVSIGVFLTVVIILIISLAIAIGIIRVYKRRLSIQSYTTTNRIQMTGDIGSNTEYTNAIIMSNYEEITERMESNAEGVVFQQIENTTYAEVRQFNN